MAIALPCLSAHPRAFVSSASNVSEFGQPYQRDVRGRESILEQLTHFGVLRIKFPLNVFHSSLKYSTGIDFEE
jgi:hypothetical protein